MMLDREEKFWIEFWGKKLKERDMYRQVGYTETSWYYRYIYLTELFRKENFNGAMICDLGCGIGLYVDYFIRNYSCSVVGVDFIKDMVAKLNDEAHKVQAAIPFLPFKNRVFDFVLCIEVFQYINDIKRALLEINRILKMGGKLYFTTLNSEFIRYNKKAKLIRRSKVFLEQQLKETGFAPSISYIPILPFKIPRILIPILYKITKNVGSLCYTVGGFATKIKDWEDLRNE